MPEPMLITTTAQAQALRLAHSQGWVPTGQMGAGPIDIRDPLTERTAQVTKHGTIRPRSFIPHTA